MHVSIYGVHWSTWHGHVHEFSIELSRCSHNSYIAVNTRIQKEVCFAFLIIENYLTLSMCGIYLCIYFEKVIEPPQKNHEKEKEKTNIHIRR